MSQVGPVLLDGPAMLLAARAAIHRNREISALVATYGVFLGGLATLAWMMA